MAKERPKSNVVSVWLTGFLFGVLATVLCQVLIINSQHAPGMRSDSYQRKVRMLIELHEGRRNDVYADSVGVATIGVGHNLEQCATADEIARLRSSGATEEQIERWLTEDIANAERELDRVFGSEQWYQNLSDNRRVVLVDMCFNLGLTRLRKFERMFGALRSGDFEAAAVEMLDSHWANQVGERAIRLSEMMRFDCYLHPKIA
ncbi:MAG: glycoside hydrolase family protein [Bdellovibrionales bacterium]|nr:glycoside hydrolase family protein [Bdellovibrionales bacterium]